MKSNTRASLNTLMLSLAILFASLLQATANTATAKPSYTLDFAANAGTAAYIVAGCANGCNRGTAMTQATENPISLIYRVNDTVQFIKTVNGHPLQLSYNNTVLFTISADSGSINYTFTEVGTYTYVCTSHASMTGTILVVTPETPIIFATYSSGNSGGSSYTSGSASASISSSGSSSLIVPCPAGQHVNSSKPTLPYCTDCSPGRFSGYESKNTSCDTCAAGNYSAVQGATTCLRCPPGKYTNTTGSSTCVDCSDDSYNKEFSSTACTQCPTRISGQYQYTGKSDPNHTRCNVTVLIILSTESSKISKAEEAGLDVFLFVFWAALIFLAWYYCIKPYCKQRNKQRVETEVERSISGEKTGKARYTLINTMEDFMY